jgi:hypothetical protein
MPLEARVTLSQIACSVHHHLIWYLYPLNPPLPHPSKIIGLKVKYELFNKVARYQEIKPEIP